MATPTTLNLRAAYRQWTSSTRGIVEAPTLKLASPANCGSPGAHGKARFSAIQPGTIFNGRPAWSSAVGALCAVARRWASARVVRHSSGLSAGPAGSGVLAFPRIWGALVASSSSSTSQQRRSGRRALALAAGRCRPRPVGSTCLADGRMNSAATPRPHGGAGMDSSGCFLDAAKKRTARGFFDTKGKALRHQVMSPVRRTANPTATSSLLESEKRRSESNRVDFAGAEIRFRVSFPRQTSRLISSSAFEIFRDGQTRGETHLPVNPPLTGHRLRAIAGKRICALTARRPAAPAPPNS